MPNLNAGSAAGTVLFSCPSLLLHSMFARACDVDPHGPGDAVPEPVVVEYIKSSLFCICARAPLVSGRCPCMKSLDVSCSSMSHYQRVFKVDHSGWTWDAVPELMVVEYIKSSLNM